MKLAQTQLTLVKNLLCRGRQGSAVCLELSEQRGFADSVREERGRTSGAAGSRGSPGTWGLPPGKPAFLLSSALASALGTPGAGDLFATKH